MKQDFTLHDQHVHTYYSEDSNELLENYINKAIALGCRYFVMTDHMDFNIANTNYDWHANYKQEAIEIASIQQKVGNSIKILQGIEIGYKKDYINQMKDVLVNEAKFDLINLSIHDYGGIDFYYIDQFVGKNYDDVIRLYLSLYIEAMNSSVDFDVVSHIDYGYKTVYQTGKYKPFKEYEDVLIPLLKTIIEKNKTLEINTKVQDAINIDHTRYLLQTYYNLGGRDITISSDAHELARYLISFDKCKEIAKEIGFTHLCYFINRKKYYYDI